MISLKTVSQKLLSMCIRFREPVVMAMVKYLFAVALVALCIIEIESIVEYRKYAGTLFPDFRFIVCLNCIYM